MPTPPASAGSDDPPAPERGGERRVPLLVVLAGMGAAIALAALVGHPSAGPGPPPRVDAVPLDARSPAEAGSSRERVLVRLDRPPLGRLPHLPAGKAATRYLASLHDEARALRGALRARGVTLDDVRSFGRVYDGFAATVPAGDLAQLPSLGVRAEPVRRFYPTADVILPGRRPLDADAAAGPVRGVAWLGAGPADPLAPLLRGARSIRIARTHREPGRPVADVYATTDQLLAGLERATASHVPVALVGVAAPYAGFADGPEARAATAASRLGTLVIAPAGNENGPVASPGGAPGALTVGAVAAPRLPAVTTPWGPGAVLGGTLPGRPLGLAPYRPGRRGLYDAAGRSLVRGRLAVVRRGPDPVTQAQDAAAAGAAAVLVADPAGRTPLPAIPPARAGVTAIGVAGEVAREALAANAGQLELTPAPASAARAAPARASLFSATGAYGAVKPGLLGPATAATPRGLVAGTGVAAAAAARAAARLAAAKPALRGAALAAALRDHPALPLRAAPPPARTTTGAGGVSGPLHLRRGREGVDGVSLVLGVVVPAGPARLRTKVSPVGRLVLDVVRPGGGVVRTLTAPGGAIDLLPGEYAYTLPKAALKDLGRGTYRFRARAWAPGAATPVTRRSERFTR